MRAGAIRLCVLLAVTLVIGPAGAHASTITVNQTQDELNGDADCSLREAVQAARDNAGDTTGCVNGEGTGVTDLILLPAGEHELDIGPEPADDENLNQTGDLDIAGDVTIRGAGWETTIVHQDLRDRTLDASPASTRTLTLEGLTLEEGNATQLPPTPSEDGGNIRMRSGGTLIIRDSRIHDGFARRGGAIWAVDDGGDDRSGSITIENSLLDASQAQLSGGGIEVIGGIAVRIEGSTLDGNAVAGRGAELLGGLISNRTDSGRGGSVAIVDSVLSDGFVTNIEEAGGMAVGGAIRNSGPLSIEGSLLTRNDVEADVLATSQHGGAIWFDRPGRSSIPPSTTTGRVSTPVTPAAAERSSSATGRSRWITSASRRTRPRSRATRWRPKMAA